MNLLDNKLPRVKNLELSSNARPASLRFRILKGFTLIELLIVIVIIFVLALIGIYIYKNYQRDARDAHRKIEIKQIKDGLQLYFADRKYYPPQNINGIQNGFIFGCGGDLNNLVQIHPGEPWNCNEAGSVSNYMKKYPEDPKPWSQPPRILGYMYAATSPDGSICFSSLNCQGYRLATCLENKNDPAGIAGDFYGVECPPDRTLYRVQQPN